MTATREAVNPKAIKLWGRALKARAEASRAMAAALGVAVRVAEHCAAAHEHCYALVGIQDEDAAVATLKLYQEAMARAAAAEKEHEAAVRRMEAAERAYEAARTVAAKRYPEYGGRVEVPGLG